MTAAQFIREKREAAGLTMEELAKAVGVSTSSVSLWEAGKRNPARSAIPRIAKAIGAYAQELSFAVDAGRASVRAENKKHAKKYPRDLEYIREYSEKNYMRPTFIVKKEDGEKIYAAAKKAGESVSSYIWKAVRARLEAEKEADRNRE